MHPTMNQTDAPRARAALSQAAADAADFAAALVPTVGDDATGPGEHIALARRLRALSVAVLDRAVLHALHCGTGWADVAAWCGLDEHTVRFRYQQMLRDDDLTAVGDLTETAAELDRWCAARLAGDPVARCDHTGRRHGLFSAGLH